MPRADPREAVRPRDRGGVLRHLQRLKMAASPHAYMRGATVKFYEWLAARDTQTIPEGPPVWICGDCHVSNLGPIANAKGHVEIQIRDLDQTVIGNPAHDLIRLALSLATAARGAALPGIVTAKMIEAIVLGYEDAFAAHAQDTDEQTRMPRVVKRVLQDATHRSWKKLLQERLVDTTPRIPIGARFWPITSKERAAVKELFTSEPLRRLITKLGSRDDDAKVRVLDAAFWVKGCSSLGRLRFAVLVGLEGHSIEDGSLCLMDIKEAVAPDAPRVDGATMPRVHGERALLGAKSLAPYLGDRMVAETFLGSSVFLRELLPQDLKVDIDRLSEREAVRAARFLASVVGKAHARQMDPKASRSWRAEMRRHRPKSMDAPSWLWSSVVDSMALHEAGYLEHCRRYARERRE